jgi:hypothetical protein
VTARTKALIAAIAATAAIVGGLLIAGVFSGGGGRKGPATSFKTGPRVGIPGLDSLTDVAGGVANAALPQLRARGGMQTIMQDDATFIYGASDDAVAAAMKRAKELGVDRIRLTAGWSVLAPEADDDQKPSFDATDPSAYTKNGWKHYDPIGHWEALDRAVRAATDAGLGVMIDVGFWAPKWATTNDPQTIRRTYNVNPQEYALFVKAVVKRYNGGYIPKYGSPPPPEQTHSGDSDLLHSVFAGGGSASFTGGSDSSSSFPFNVLDSGSGSNGSSGSAGSGPSGDGSSGKETQPGSGTATAAAKPLPRVSFWTIWNEPNHMGFIQPQWRKQGSRLVPNGPYLYRALVDAGYPAIKGIQPDSTVLVGATSSMGNENPRKESDGMAPLTFLRALACVDKKLRPISSGPCANFRPLPGDGYSHHPYELLHTPDYSDRRHTDYAMIGDLQRLTNTLNRLAAMHRIDPKVRDVWLTEFGYESNPPDPVKPFSPDEQARFINWAEYLAWKNPQVKSFPQFLLQDMGKVSEADAARGKRDYGDWQSGLYFNDGTPKPAATSFPLALHVDCTTELSKAAEAKDKKSKGARAAKKAKLLVIWGHVRPGDGPRQVTIESGAGTFRPAATATSLSSGKVRAASVTPFSTDSSGFFLRFAPYAKRAQFRVSYRDAGGQTRTGLAVAPDVCSGTTKQKRVRGAGANEF